MKKKRKKVSFEVYMNQQNRMSKPLIAVRVKFIGKNGMDWELKQAKFILETGAIYRVEAIYIRDWKTEIALYGKPYLFNSVMFEPVEYIY